VSPRELSRPLEGRPQAEIEEAGKLLAAAKSDANNLSASGRTKAHFEGLLREAQTPLESSICRLRTDVADDKRNRRLEALMQEVARPAPEPAPIPRPQRASRPSTSAPQDAERAPSCRPGAGTAIPSGLILRASARQPR